MNSGISILQEILTDCTDSERKAAEYILNHPESVVLCTITELGRQSTTSAPAIVRLCKRAGLSGYRELQVLLAKDVYSLEPGKGTGFPDFQLETGMDVKTIAREVVERSKDGLDRLLDILNPEAVAETVSRILSGRTIQLVGVGASGLVAADFAQKLLRLGLPCVYSTDPDVQITAACAAGPRDTVIAFSWSGENPSTVRTLEEAKAGGAWVAAVTHLGGSPVARWADCLLATPAIESSLRLGAMVSRMSQLAVVDILYAAVVSRNLELTLPRIEKSMRATHPGLPPRKP